MHSIGYTELGDFDKAEQLFRRSYETYVRPPFNVSDFIFSSFRIELFGVSQVWTEAQSGVGAVNFITGAGGFLQAVLFGYGGIRLKLDQLEFKPRGHLPAQTTKFIFHGIKYQGTSFDLTIDNKMYEVFVSTQNNDDCIPLVYEHGEHRGLLKTNDRLSFPVGTPLIIRRSVAFCS
jgi:hypothetical protein